jgi:hypothetical protein
MCLSRWCQNAFQSNYITGRRVLITATPLSHLLLSFIFIFTTLVYVKWYLFEWGFCFCFLFFVFSTEVLTQGLHFEPLPALHYYYIIIIIIIWYRPGACQVSALTVSHACSPFVLFLKQSQANFDQADLKLPILLASASREGITGCVPPCLTYFLFSFFHCCTWNPGSHVSHTPSPVARIFNVGYGLGIQLKCRAGLACVRPWVPSPTQ